MIKMLEFKLNIKNINNICTKLIITITTIILISTNYVPCFGKSLGMSKQHRSEVAGEELIKNGLFKGKYAVFGDMLLPVRKNSANELIMPGGGTIGGGAPVSVDRWPGGVIPYVMSYSFNADQQQVIIDAMDAIMASTCIKFKTRDQESNYVNIGLHDESNVCYAVVGRDSSSNGQDLMLGSQCVTHHIVVHELVHSIGFFHEHTRMDRDDFVTIIWDNIIQNQQHNFQKTRTSTFNVPYDYGSIMHYYPYAWARDMEKRTIESKPPGANFGRARQLSNYDKMKINRMYNCGSASSSSPFQSYGSSDNGNYVGPASVLATSPNNGSPKSSQVQTGQQQPTSNQEGTSFKIPTSAFVPNLLIWILSRF